MIEHDSLCWIEYNRSSSKSDDRIFHLHSIDSEDLNDSDESTDSDNYDDDNDSGDSTDSDEYDGSADIPDSDGSDEFEENDESGDSAEFDDSDGCAGLMRQKHCIGSVATGAWTQG